MGNYICLCNLQLVRGQQVCLAYSTQRKTLTGNILFYEAQVAPLTFTHIPENGIFQPITAGKTESTPLTYICNNPEQLQ